MIVGIDATGWVNRRGFGRFARNVVTPLIERDRTATYRLYIDDATASELNPPNAAEIRRVPLRQAPSTAASAESSRGLGDVLRMSAAVSRDALDVFLFPSLHTYFPVWRVPTVIGIHDTIATDLPHLAVPGLKARTLWQAKQWLAVRRATRIFTVSEAARSAVAHRLHLPSTALEIVPEGPDPVFRPAAPAAIDAARRTIGLASQERYLLYVGGISPHKNIETLLDAFARLQAPRPRLVLVGELESETYASAVSSVRQRITGLSLEPDVMLPGFVPDEALAALYSGAAAVVNPSLAEGFGLPAVEAAACGAPVVLSDLPAHRETLGDSACFFSPRDAEQLAREMDRLLTHEEERQRLAARGRAAVARLSWSVAADRLRALLMDAARGQ